MLKRKREEKEADKTHNASVTFNPSVISASHEKAYSNNNTVFTLQHADHYKKRNGRRYILDLNGRPVSSFGYTSNPNAFAIVDKQTSAEKQTTVGVYIDEQNSGIFLENEDGTSTPLFKWKQVNGKKVLVSYNENEDDNTLLKNTKKNMYIDNINETNPELTRVCSDDPNYNNCTTLFDYVKNFISNITRELLSKRLKLIGGKKSKSRKLKTAKKQKKRKTIRRRK